MTHDEQPPSSEISDSPRDAGASTEPSPDRVELLRMLALLEAAVDDRALLAPLSEEERKRLLQAAGRVSNPSFSEIKRLRKQRRRERREHKKDADSRLLETTGIRTLRQESAFPTPSALPPGTPPPELLTPEASPTATYSEAVSAKVDSPRPLLQEACKCYVCKAEYRQVHHFYDQLCPPCAELNWARRHQSADLSGRVALITGARVKIGYQAAIKLLRAGAHVVVTTRFAADAAARYAREEDFESFRSRLEIHALDLRHTPSVEDFCTHMLASLPRLDFIIHNACQTVRRPPAFYSHLMKAEQGVRAELTSASRSLLTSYDRHKRSMGEAEPTAPSDPTIADPPNERFAAQKHGMPYPAALSQIPLVEEDMEPALHLFPQGQLDQDLQQVDLRGINSWRLRMHEVSAVELLEVQLVNAVAPFVISARLKRLMCKVASVDKHVVNVSAMEGQFYRRWKTDRHPHTNMAKAALNMLTRTSAADFLKDGIHMNSVDTGWVTDEDPAQLAEAKVAEHGFHPPLDIVDGAARIVDPIFYGLNTGKHLWGLFLKDYRAIPW